MYFERIGKCLKIIEEIENCLTKGQTESLWTKKTVSASIVTKIVISNLNVEPN